MPSPPDCCTLTGMDHGSRGLRPTDRTPAASWAPPGIVGREAELRQIDEYVDTLESGPRSILLIGEAGIGKTTLWNYGLARCRAHHRQVLVTRASQDDHQVLGQGLLDLFDPRHLPDDLTPSPWTPTCQRSNARGSSWTDSRPWPPAARWSSPSTTFPGWTT